MTDQLLCSPTGTPGLECPLRALSQSPQNIPKDSSLRMSHLEAYNFPLAQYHDSPLLSPNSGLKAQFAGIRPTDHK